MHDALGPVGRERFAGEISRVECADDHVDDRIKIGIGAKVSTVDCGDQDGGEPGAPRADDLPPERRDQLRRVRLLDEQGADHGQAVGPEELDLEVAERGDQVSSQRADERQQDRLLKTARSRRRPAPLLRSSGGRSSAWSSSPRRQPRRSTSASSLPRVAVHSLGVVDSE